ncbi:MAG TPA: hypothetical protein PLZ45_03855 [Ferruginibacter sp.]|nr:hypothetical protein [Chitinophagaceae bacterium]HRI23782.1 hypothetical protein [Ferruginibacter sp.]
MKKIKSIKHLKAEKKRLKQRQGELEKAIRYDWMDVKETLKPRNLAGQAFSGMFDERSAEKKPGADLVAEVLTKLAAKAFEKAGDKIGKWMRRK